TGKTLGYLLATLPLAQALGYRVVVATATVALQEQLTGKDIPEILQGSDLKFSYALAKGRSRYLCLAKLDSILKGSTSLMAMRDLYGEDLATPADDQLALCTDMLAALAGGDWQGDRDDWKQPLADAQWRPLTVERGQCMGPKCSHFRNCCFYTARDSLDKADCIVSNQDLVLTDLVMGGGVILPEPEKCIYIFDEAHHLPGKSNSHFAAGFQLRSTSRWLGRCDAIWQSLESEGLLNADEGDMFRQLGLQLREQLDEVCLLLEQLINGGNAESKYENRRQYTFPSGVIPPELMEAAAAVCQLFQRLEDKAGVLHDRLGALLDDTEEQDVIQLTEQWMPVVGSICDRLDGALRLWQQYVEADDPAGAPSARWLSSTDNNEYIELGIYASPVLAADNLEKQLWERCAGAVLTSATLSALGEFTNLQRRAGLPEHTHYLSIPSPFDFANAARILIPQGNCDPAFYEEHTDFIVDYLSTKLELDTAALMLFSSRRQMLDVIQRLPENIVDKVLCQDDYQKSQLIKYHCKRIDDGDGSIIFGLASFAEGVDLPGKYCTRVLIAKIPFAVPDDPIESTLAAWVEQQGENAFMTLAVPDAAFRLVQASGRLLRSDSDRGEIVLFDDRIVRKPYGRTILASLPPYTRADLQLNTPDSAGFATAG
ncbi:MAG: ATP-dependent DNA helicase DinG, partial [Gammaproteobacteria bacterium]